MLLTKGLLSGILIFSFISIAGYSTISDSIFGQNCQTELIYSNLVQRVNKTGLYRKGFLRKKQTAFHSQQSNLFSLLTYSRLTKIKLQNLFKKKYLISIPKRLYLVNNIPQNSGEDSFSSFTS